MSGRKRAYVQPTEQGVDMSIALARAKRNFSYRLFEALESNKRGPARFLYWSKDGISFYVDDVEFHQQVMYVFPGLVATPSFKNFYRQLRVYGFDSVESGCDGKQQFAHPYFQRGREDLLIHVQSTINKGARARHAPPQPGCPSNVSSPSYSQSPHQHSVIYDLSSGDRAAACGGPMYSPFIMQRLPDPIKLTSDTACQTMISMETFARLDPRDVSVSALMLPALVGFLDNCNEENRERERQQYREQINQEFQLLSSPVQEHQPIASPQPQQYMYSPPHVSTPPQQLPSHAVSTPVHTPQRDLPPLDAKPVVVTVIPEHGDSKVGARTLFNL